MIRVAVGIVLRHIWMESRSRKTGESFTVWTRGVCTCIGKEGQEEEGRSPWRERRAARAKTARVACPARPGLTKADRRGSCNVQRHAAWLFLARHVLLLLDAADE
jgi:hypothetical protein